MVKIGGIQKSTLIDYPGKIACVVFLSGCNFRCPFCYSPELVLPEKIKEHPCFPEKDFFDFLQQRKKKLDGVVVLGGEPTIWGKELVKFISRIKKMGFLIKVDSNGSNPDILNELIKNKLIDYVAMDLKNSKEKYSETVGLAKTANKELVKKIEESMKILKSSNIDFEFRTTIVPGIHIQSDILKIIDWALSIEPRERKIKYFLQSFVPRKTLNPAFVNLGSFPKQYLEEIEKAVNSPLIVVKIRN